MSPHDAHMNKITLQIHRDGKWLDAMEVTFYAPDKGHKGRTRLDYLAPYVIEYLQHPNQAAVSCRYPVDFSSHPEEHWPAFLLDLLPGGEGRRRWAEQLGVTAGISGELTLLQHAAANPAGNIRVKESAMSPYRVPEQLPNEAGQLTPLQNHAGFSRASIIEKQEHFIEYAYNFGAAVAGASDVQGEAPKFLLVEDQNGQWHAEGALADKDVKKHWIVKFARGNTETDRKILRNEAAYLEVARRFGIGVAESLQFESGALFIPRFDRIQHTSHTERVAMESLYSVAGIAEFGAFSRHETLLDAMMLHIDQEDYQDTALEYIKRDILNVVMGNTDNHGRNTALLRGLDGKSRLSPLFDFAPMYLDPAGIARVSRWDNDKEHAGRPDWHAVTAYFTPWVDRTWLLKQLALLATPLAQLTTYMQIAGIDGDIIEQRKPSLENNIQLLRKCGNG